MNERECQPIRELLVEFSDGELETALAARVEAHLELCPGCRRQLDRLRSSLELAGEVWYETAQRAAEVEFAPVQQRLASPRRVVFLVMSSAAALLIGLLVFQHIGKDEPPLTGGAESPGGVPEDTLAGKAERAPGAQIETTTDDLLALIDRAERRARLEASLEILEQTPSLEPYAEKAEQYLAAALGESSSVDALDVHNPSGKQEERL